MIISIKGILTPNVTPGYIGIGVYGVGVGVGVGGPNADGNGDIGLPPHGRLISTS